MNSDRRSADGEVDLAPSANHAVIVVVALLSLALVVAALMSVGGQTDGELDTSDPAFSIPTTTDPFAERVSTDRRATKLADGAILPKSDPFAGDIFALTIEDELMVIDMATRQIKRIPMDFTPRNLVLAGSVPVVVGVDFQLSPVVGVYSGVRILTVSGTVAAADGETIWVHSQSRQGDVLVGISTASEVLSANVTVPMDLPVETFSMLDGRLIVGGPGATRWAVDPAGRVESLVNEESFVVDSASGSTVEWRCGPVPTCELVAIRADVEIVLPGSDTSSIRISTDGRHVVNTRDGDLFIADLFFPGIGPLEAPDDVQWVRNTSLLWFAEDGEVILFDVDGMPHAKMSLVWKVTMPDDAVVSAATMVLAETVP